jgi:predicted MPP superfamily phosphohydrolase
MCAILVKLDLTFIALKLRLSPYMKHSFVHVSDLHYRPAWHEENGLVCSRFFEDVKTQMGNFENLYFVFSGDIVFAGGNPDLYTGFDKDFASQLDKMGIPKERRICVPGNHDVSREALKPNLRIEKGSLSGIKDEGSFNDTLPQLSKLFLRDNFENYKTYESRFAHYTSCAAGLGGAGWDLADGIGVYCLNTAVCSFGGIDDENGKPISDQNQLMIDTRSLHKWLTENSSKFRILVMHHPLDWLAQWAKSELQKIIQNSFKLVFSGHVHENAVIFSSRGVGGSLSIVAPPLFTRKSDLLGYSFVKVDVDGMSEVIYRQWSPTQKFVPGTSLAGNETGKMHFPSLASNYIPLEVLPQILPVGDTLGILQAEFDEATTCYSSKKRLWVNRDLANVPEIGSGSGDVVIRSCDELAKSPRSCIIRAPKQFGLTCLGRSLALEHYRQSTGHTVLVMLDTAALPHHRQGIVDHIVARCHELQIERKSIAGFILDDWVSNKGNRRLLRELKTEYTELPIIILASVDDCGQIASAMEIEEEATFETLFLWALSRTRIRELTAAYLQGMDSLDDDLVTKKVTDDIDALNIHRTPLNCLLILKLTEQAFDDSPVNRTEMIGRVLYLLFYQYDKIPRYATRPDLKDCEFALGYFCESLVRTGKKNFSKNEFYQKIQEYCSKQVLDLDIEVLFAFLVNENIFMRKGIEFEFRSNFWLYFFAAHRMHHDAEFAEFILAERRYSAFPEIVEFYAGIDRMRTDAIVRLTKDLDSMDADFLQRSGMPAGFSPFKNAQWAPTDEAVEKLKKELGDSLAESQLPAVVKDAIADKKYNRAKPYNQALARFINESSLIQMVQAMKGAARALRNSDHVSPNAKAELLERVLRCWVRVCQILVVLSPVLAEQGRAGFEGMSFYLDKTFDKLETPAKRWKALLTCIVDNIITWYHQDIFSKKMGALFSNYVKAHPVELGELLVLLVLAKQRPPGWEREIERFIVREHKNSFALSRVFVALSEEFKVSFSTEQTRQQLRYLAAMAIAKHATGSKYPNTQLIEKAAKQVLDKVEEK